MHRWSKLFVPTLREAPADAEVASHKLLLRAGYIRQLGAGIYNYLFLGQRSLNKIVGIVRQEMDTIGQEFYLPAILPKEPWTESGRWSGMGDNMFRLKDRKGAELCLGMTHEEIMTVIARGELRSYKQLPQIWYQIQTKFRDEPRPKAGLLRVRQFMMKDSYSFDLDAAGLDKSFDLHDAVYRRIFSRCGLKFVAVEADSGAMGGSQSQEFMVYTDAGEDLIASCPACGYAANVEKATSRLEPLEEMAATGDGTPELVSTPGCAAIADVAAFFKISPASDIKCVAYMALKRAATAKEKDTWHGVAAFLRGDHQVNETKLLGAIGAAELRTMQAEELQQYLSGPAGYLGPVGLKPDGTPLGEGVTVVVDRALEGRKNMVCGANKQDYHLRNVAPGRDFGWTLMADIRSVNEGEKCPKPGCDGQLLVGKAVEVGHIFKLGESTPNPWGRGCLTPTARKLRPSWAVTASASSVSSRRPSSSQTTPTAFACLHPSPRSPSSSPSPTWVTRPCAPLASKLPPSLNRQGSTCCSMTETSAPASNSKTLIWLAYPTALMWGKKFLRAWWSWWHGPRPAVWMWGLRMCWRR